MTTMLGFDDAVCARAGAASAGRTAADTSRLERIFVRFMFHSMITQAPRWVEHSVGLAGAARRWTLVVIA
jgi:hypothetical protein